MESTGADTERRVDEKEKARKLAEGRDPWIYFRSKGETARRIANEERERAANHPKFPPKSEDRGFTLRRRQSMVLGILFATLALIFYLGTKVAQPRLVVDLKGGRGTVLIDGVDRGRTGQLINVPTIGEHTVTVRPDSAGQVIVPAQRDMRFGFGLTPITLTFHVVTPMRLSPDSSNVE